MFSEYEIDTTDVGHLHMSEYLEAMPQTELILSPLTLALPLLPWTPLYVNGLAVHQSLH